ncbi:MAG: alpha/beta hydrolase [Mycetocola sp.]
MNSRHLVDPEMQPMIDMVPSISFTPELLAVVRQRSVQLAAPDHDVTSPVDTTSTTVPGPPGAPDIRVVVSRPRDVAPGALPAVLFVHGGGFVLGTPEQFQPLVDEIVLATPAVVVSVDYRLAPETRHPGPLLDCVAALDWIRNHVDELGIDDQRIAVVGESAGGGLATALALHVRGDDTPPLRFLGLIYPMLDDRTIESNENQNPMTGEFIWTRTSNTFGWSALLGDEPADRASSPLAAAARARDVNGMPPTFIAVGALDLFVDEDIAFAQLLIRSGIATELHVHPGGVHGYIGLPDARIARTTRADLIDALQRTV